MVTFVEKGSTMLVLTVKVALVVPAAMVTLGGEGTCATPGLLLESAICAPPGGAGLLSVTVPWEDPMSGPPVTLDGFSVSEARVGGLTVSDAVCFTPL
jgi:hypothetical protein